MVNYKTIGKPKKTCDSVNGCPREDFTMKEMISNLERETKPKSKKFQDLIELVKNEQKKK